MALGFEFIDKFDRATLAVFFRHHTRARIFVHGQGVHRDVRAAERIRRWGQVVSVDFALNLEHGQGDGGGHFRA